MNRRDLLKAAAAMMPITVAGHAFAAPHAANARMLMVFLRGAYDAANIVVPTGTPFYYQARPTLAIARPDPGNPDAAVALDADWSLHPALADSILPLWRKGQMAFVPFAGPDDMTRSHFETQDTIELGQPFGKTRNYRSGFMARLADILDGGRPISFTDQVPLCFRGENIIPNIALNSVGRVIVDPRQAALITTMYQGHQSERNDLEGSVVEGFRVKDVVSKSLAGEEVAANRGAISSRGFELSGRRIGRLMRDQFNLAFIDVGGWDTHVGQGGAKGYLATRIRELGNGLAAFADEIGDAAWHDTTVVVISEFGRTFRENGDKGTDHGHGSIYWVLGGQVRGGRMVGPQVTISEATLNEGRDLPVLTDYRDLIGGLMARQYALSADHIQRIFPGAKVGATQLI